jgi:hypothetical protein
MVLQQALASGNTEAVSAVIKLLKEAGNEEALKKNLANKTKDGFMVFQHAIASGNIENVSVIISLLREVGNEGALKKNLANKTKDDFMVLQDALKSGSTENVSAVIELLKENKPVLRENLYQANKYRYNCLHQAANTKNNNLALLSLLVKAIQENFGDEGFNIIMDLMRDVSKFKNPHCKSHEVQKIIDQIYPRVINRKTYVPMYDKRRNDSNTQIGHKRRGAYIENHVHHRQKFV